MPYIAFWPVPKQSNRVVTIHSRYITTKLLTSPSLVSTPFWSDHDSSNFFCNTFYQRILLQEYLTVHSGYGLNEVRLRSRVVVAEWSARLTAKLEVCGSNPASHFCWNTHVGKVTGCYAGHIHRRCHTRGESQGIYTMYASVNHEGSTLALKPRDVTRSPKQGYQWSHKRTCVQQIFF